MKHTDSEYEYMKNQHKLEFYRAFVSSLYYSLIAFLSLWASGSAIIIIISYFSGVFNPAHTNDVIVVSDLIRLLTAFIALFLSVIYLIISPVRGTIFFLWMLIWSCVLSFGGIFIFFIDENLNTKAIAKILSIIQVNPALIGILSLLILFITAFSIKRVLILHFLNRIKDADFSLFSFFLRNFILFPSIISLIILPLTISPVNFESYLRLLPIIIIILSVAFIEVKATTEERQKYKIYTLSYAGTNLLWITGLFFAINLIFNYILK